MNLPAFTTTADGKPRKHMEPKCQNPWHLDRDMCAQGEMECERPAIAANRPPCGHAECTPAACIYGQTYAESRKPLPTSALETMRRRTDEANWNRVRSTALAANLTAHDVLTLVQDTADCIQARRDLIAAHEAEENAEHEAFTPTGFVPVGRLVVKDAPIPPTPDRHGSLMTHLAIIAAGLLIGAGIVAFYLITNH